MAKIHHNNYLSTINELITDAINKGILHLSTGENNFSGRNFTIGNKNMLNFGTCGYLALENDDRVKEEAIEHIQKYGTQFSVSRTYLSAQGYTDLENLMSQIYNGLPVIVYPSTSTAHISVIPTIISANDAVILDQQAHMSVQTATQLLRQKGVPIEMIRHNNLDMLETYLKKMQNKFEKVWYMADGVYSMYGDVAPVEDLLALSNKYSHLHLYYDDAHGMSWHGKNGAGYVFEKTGVPENTVLITTLAKGFGVTGGLAVFPENSSYEKTRLFGGPLTYSHPLAPPLVGAAIASARIHLSPEIYEMQEQLQTLTTHCNNLLEKSGLPVISDTRTPIYFVGMGQPKVGYNMVKRLLNDGFYVNLSLFPAVPVKNTGLRFTLNRHLLHEDISALIAAIEYHYPLALAEENTTHHDVLKAFKLADHKNQKEVIQEENPFTIEYFNSISEIDPDVWDSFFADEGIFDANGLSIMERAFSKNSNPVDNFDFHYYIVKSRKEVVLATFFTSSILKDDLFAPENVSRQIEAKRDDDELYLTSYTLGMGNMLTEGRHLFINRDFKEWKAALQFLIKEVNYLHEKLGTTNIMFRDFKEEDDEIKEFFIQEGFFKIEMPKSNIIEGILSQNVEDYFQLLSGKNRRHIRNDVETFAHHFKIEIKPTLTEDEITEFHRLYMEVKSRNFAINYYPYPEKLFREFSNYKNWEFVILRLKEVEDEPIVAIGACYVGKNSYSPLVLGLDYNWVYEYKCYKQLLYRVVERSIKLGKKKLYFGFSADVEKRKLGAQQNGRVAFIQAKDNFNFEVIESMGSISIAN